MTFFFFLISVAVISFAVKFHTLQVTAAQEKYRSRRQTFTKMFPNFCSPFATSGILLLISYRIDADELRMAESTFGRCRQ